MADAIELARIKRAAADTLAEELLAYNLTPHDVQKVGQAVLDAIDTAARDDTDPSPFAPKRRVRYAAGSFSASLARGMEVAPRGTIVRSISQYGEVHTVYVHWDGIEGETPHSPSELEVIQ